jgi:hypothetical protein
VEDGLVIACGGRPLRVLTKRQDRGRDLGWRSSERDYGCDSYLRTVDIAVRAGV